MKKLFLIVALLLPAFGHAQEVLGRSIVEGRSITILADGTWEYADAADPTCDMIYRGVEFCGGAAGWQRTTPPNSEISASYRFDDRHYGQMIIEALGEDDGLTSKAMRQIVIQNAAAATGVLPSDIAVIDVHPSVFAGQDIETIVYTLDVEGVDVVFANAISTSPRQTMQLMTYAIGPEYTDQHRSLHEAFLSEIKLQK
jgi:hypothetical protein